MSVKFFGSEVGSTHAELNGDREEVDTGSFGNWLTAWNSRKVDVAGLDNTLFALGGFDDFLGETEAL